MSDILRRISVAFLLEALKATYGSRSVVDQSSSDSVSRRKGGGRERREGGCMSVSWTSQCIACAGKHGAERSSSIYNAIVDLKDKVGNSSKHVRRTYAREGIVVCQLAPSSAIEKSARLNVLLLGPLDIFEGDTS